MNSSSLIVFEILNDPPLLPLSQWQLLKCTCFVGAPNLELYSSSWLAKCWATSLYFTTCPSGSLPVSRTRMSGSPNEKGGNRLRSPKEGGVPSLCIAAAYFPPGLPSRHKSSQCVLMNGVIGLFRVECGWRHLGLLR